MILRMTKGRRSAIAAGLFGFTFANGLATLVGCADSSSVSDFDSVDANARFRAIREAGKSGDQGAVRALVTRLASDDPAERLLSIRALEKITGTTLGYDHAASRTDREAAIARWVKWCSTQSSPAEKGSESSTGGDSTDR